MLLWHTAGLYARSLMIAGGLIVGFTVVSAFPATACTCPSSSRRHCAAAATSSANRAARFSLVAYYRFFMAPHTGSPTIYFGTMLLFAAIGALVPIVWGKETIGQIEVIAAETVPEFA